VAIEDEAEAEVVVEAEVEPGEGGELEATGELKVDVEPDVTMILGSCRGQGGRRGRGGARRGRGARGNRRALGGCGTRCILYSDECDDAVKWKDSDLVQHLRVLLSLFQLPFLRPSNSSLHEFGDHRGADEPIRKSSFGRISQHNVDSRESHMDMGFTMLMGINVLPAMSDYWHKDQVCHYAPLLMDQQRSLYRRTVVSSLHRRQLPSKQG